MDILPGLPGSDTIWQPAPTITQALAQMRLHYLALNIHNFAAAQAFWRWFYVPPKPKDTDIL